MLKSVLNRNIVLACSADCPADNHACQLAQFLYETLALIFKKMNKILLAFFLLMITVSCGTDNNSHQTKKEMERLQVQNDSLKEIIQELNSKYIFDSI